MSKSLYSIPRKKCVYYQYCFELHMCFMKKWSYISQ